MNDNQDNNGTNHADGMPALLAAFHAIGKDQVKWSLQTFRASSKDTPCLARFDAASHRATQKSRLLLYLQKRMYTARIVTQVSGGRNASKRSIVQLLRLWRRIVTVEAFLAIRGIRDAKIKHTVWKPYLRLPVDLGAWCVFAMADPAGTDCSQLLLRPEAVDQETIWLAKLRNAPQSPAARNILRLLERLDHAGRSASPRRAPP